MRRIFTFGLVLATLAIPSAQAEQTSMTITIVEYDDTALISWTPVLIADAYRVYQEDELIYEGLATTTTGVAGARPVVMIVVDGTEMLVDERTCVEVRHPLDWPPPYAIYEC